MSKTDHGFEKNTANGLGRRSVLKGGGFLLAGLAAPAILGRAARAADGSKSVKIADTVAGTTVSAYSSIIKDFNLAGDYDIQWVPADSGQVQNFLLAGALDVGRFGPIGLSQAILKGHDLVFIGGLHRSTSTFIVPASSPVQTVEDLKGKKIGALGPSTDDYKLAKVAFTLNGWDFGREFQVVPGNVLANEALLRRGDVDAILTGQPGINRFIAEGFRPVGNVGELWKKATGWELEFAIGSAVTRKWLDENRQRAQDVAAIFVSAITKLRDNPDVIKTYAKLFGVDPEKKDVLDLLVENLPGSLQPGWDDKVFASIDKQIQISVDAGVLERVPDQKVYATW